MKVTQDQINNYKIRLRFTADVKYRKFARVVSALSPPSNILPIGLHIGIAYYWERHPQWWKTVQESPLAQLKLATLIQTWRIPDLSRYVEIVELDVIMIDLPEWIDGKTVVWFCRDEFKLLVK